MNFFINNFELALFSGLSTALSTEKAYPCSKIPQICNLSTDIIFGAQTYALACSKILCHCFCLFNNIIDGAGKQKCGFRNIVVLAFKDFVEAADGFGKRNVFSLKSGELLCNVERLRKESFNLSCAGNGKLLFLGKLIHTKNRDDVLKLFVLLKNLLNGTGGAVRIRLVESSGSTAG